MARQRVNGKRLRAHDPSELDQPTSRTRSDTCCCCRCEAYFSYDINYLCGGQVWVTLFDESTEVHCGEVSSVLWSIDRYGSPFLVSGSPTTFLLPVATPGVWTVNQTTTFSNGCTDTVVGGIEVESHRCECLEQSLPSSITLQSSGWPSGTSCDSLNGTFSLPAHPTIDCTWGGVVTGNPWSVYISCTSGQLWISAAATMGPFPRSASYLKTISPFSQCVGSHVLSLTSGSSTLCPPNANQATVTVII